MRIAVHAFDGITMFHLSAPLLVFGVVGRLGLAPDWETTVWTSDGEAIRTAEGLSVGVVSGPEVLADADLVVLPSWPSDLPVADDRLVRDVRAAHDRGASIAGLCLGAFPVVDAGLLDGRVAVTHWAAVDRLAARRPGVGVDAAALYRDYGDVLTSAGTASALDACVDVVRTRLGSAVATTVSRHLVVAPHRDGDQAQYVERPVTEPGGVGHLAPTLEWAQCHLHEPLSVDDLARHARMSRRNFTRRFEEVTGTSPARWVLARRLDESRRLLETTDRPVAEVARACGFASAVTFRQRFVAAYATTPSSYRSRFTSPGPVDGHP
ncbi:GlxA family transcriptional regulator [Nocardioides rubriscoriae]|uniref:GlxA family transcriptional regulator n=1 Tax=Nocardioides rubriscoriae TaxID=642762 RepID=UPI0011DFE378|nr:helix-turn-helix domain-containing protein [Nocardioides rubriscoriae]